MKNTNMQICYNYKWEISMIVKIWKKEKKLKKFNMKKKAETDSWMTRLDAKERKIEDKKNWIKF
jgi:hypothetical protein